MLDEHQHQEFFERGFTRVSGAIPPEAAAAMVDCFWNFIEKNQNVRRDDPATWVEGQVYGISELKQEPVFEQIGSKTTLSVLDALLGKDRWQRAATWGQILATFPATDRTWSWNSIFQQRVDVPMVMWHTDYEYHLPPDELAGVQVFALLADLEPGGGGTLVIEGSSGVIRNFVQKQPSATLRQKMKKLRIKLMDSDPWFQSISKPVSLPRPDQWMAKQNSVIDGIPVSIAELTGKAGDVFFCHPWLLHAPSPNCNETPRLMCTQRLRKRV